MIASKNYLDIGIDWAVVFSVKDSISKGKDPNNEHLLKDDDSDFDKDVIVEKIWAVQKVFVAN